MTYKAIMIMQEFDMHISHDKQTSKTGHEWRMFFYLRVKLGNHSLVILSCVSRNFAHTRTLRAPILQEDRLSEDYFLGR